MQEKTNFFDSNGNKVWGILSNPTSDCNTPIVILCHGFTTSKDNSTYIQLEQVLNKQQIATFRFDFFGHGVCVVSFEDITISQAVDDIQNAIKYLKTKGFSKLGLMGSSFGGMASTMAASTTSDLFVLVLKSPISDYFEVETKRKTKEEMEEWKTKGWILHKDRKLNYTFVEDFENNNAYKAAKKINVPTLIIHGDSDETVPIEQSKKLTSHIQDCTLEIIVGADHKYTHPDNFEKMLNVVSAFIDRCI